ncbi:SusC/RagA family TonB-linked outer membrane protein [Puteibacter caeruleilacunae]|nr:SusC/RagA family TonB-linked outer membrane protein [Puteibacter caeruleilacunae]
MKKNYQMPCFMRNETMKLLLKMKLVVLFLCIGFIQVNATVFSQNAKVSLEMEDVTIEQVLREIEQLSNIRFFFQREQVNVEKTVSVKVKDTQIKDILDQILQGQHISYKKYGDKTIILVPEIAKSKEVGTEDKKIAGKVTDEDGEPLPGVTVIAKGTTVGVTTDFDGNYSLSVPGSVDVLVFSFVGMKTQEVVIGGQTAINVVMTTDAIGLDEVVAVGYGVQKKVNLTGAVSSVKMEDVLSDRPVVNVTQALQGSVPGLKIETTNAEPGKSPSFNIRGTTSINGGGPLVLVDNVPMEISTLNPDDIETVSVLKDAASTAIYGARAAYGVILITTKRAKENTPFTLNYNNNIAFQRPVTLPKYATMEETLQLYEDMAAGSGLTDADYWTGHNITKWKEYLADYRANPDKYPDGMVADGATYYLKESNQIRSMIETGVQHQHNVSATGGTDKLTYRFSLGYMNQDGILITDKDKYKRITTSAYTSARITDWLRQEIDIKYTKSERSNPDGNQYNWALTDGVWTPDGTLTHTDGVEYPVRNAVNTILFESPAKTYIETPRVFAKTTITPIKNLTVVGEYTYSKKVYDYKNYENTFYMYDVTEAGPEIANGQDWYYYNTYKQNRNTINAYATYKFNIGDAHNFTAMAGFNQEHFEQSSLNVKILDQIVPSLPSIVQATGTPIAEDGFTEYATRGGFYRFNYDYKGKLLFEANGRYDGSSRFPTDSRFAFFPSFSAGYRISEEAFMKSADWLSNLKLRASWGKIGNQNVSNYGYLPTMDSGQIGWLVNGTKPIGTYPPGLVSSNYTWETVYSTNFGADFGFFNGQLTGSVDVYQRDTNGMLTAGETLPEVLGPPSPKENAADLTTKGWEVSLQYRGKIGDFKYNVGVNMYDSWSEITKFANKSGLLSDYYVGREIGEIWGYTTDRFFTADDINADPNLLAGGGQLKDEIAKPEGVNNFWPGDIKYVDLNNDGEITDGTSTLDDPGDRSIIGNSTPRYQYGFNVGADYKGFSFSAVFQGVGKRDLTTTNAAIFWPGLNFQPAVFKSVLDYWTPENTDAYFPRLYDHGGGNSGYNRRTQTKYLQNGAYLRLKSVTFGYNLPKNICKKMYLSRMKLFVSGENLYTWDHLPDGIDPELKGFKYPFYRTISFGVNVTL